MKGTHPVSGLLLLLLVVMYVVATPGYILEAKRASNFAPDVESLWQQAEQGIFRKDENGNFERFLRGFGQSPRAIETLAAGLEIRLNLDLSK